MRAERQLNCYQMYCCMNSHLYGIVDLSLCGLFWLGYITRFATGLIFFVQYGWCACRSFLFLSLFLCFSLALTLFVCVIVCESANVCLVAEEERWQTASQFLFFFFFPVTPPPHLSRPVSLHAGTRCTVWFGVKCCAVLWHIELLCAVLCCSLLCYVKRKTHF